MKRISAILAAGMMLFFFSCNNDGDKKDETKVADTTAAPAPVVAEPVFTPYKIAVIQHSVKDYAKWKVGYLAHDSMRLAYGVSQYRLGRGIPDSNMVIVVDKIADVAKAKEFAASPGLKDAMTKAGVTGKPTISFVDVVRHDDSKVDQKERVMITHKVKDYAAWLKAYDAEGKAKRAEYGLMDRSLGRGVDDSNMVHIVFVITDMAKAKARIASEDLKKLMTDAGVEGPPQLIFFKLDN